jgi:hypothetical protein
MTMITGANSKKPWNKWDRLLMEAYQILEDERCPQCGYPRYICNNESNELVITLGQDHCAIKARIDRKNDQDSSREGYKAPFGVVVHPEVYSTVTGAELAGYREPYYRAEVAKRKEILASRHVESES